MTNEQIAEVNRIHAAVDDFASAMKTRLTQKLEAGYTGWDGEYPSSTLRRELVGDALELWDTADDWNAVDIANRAMMLWYRSECLRRAGE